MPKKPRVLDNEEMAQVEAMASVLTSEQIADYLGISRATFYEIMERQPDVAGRYKKGKARAIGSVAKSLYKKAIDGDTASMIFFLKTQAGWREVNRVDMTSSDGSMASKPDRIVITGVEPGDNAD